MKYRIFGIFFACAGLFYWIGCGAEHFSKVSIEGKKGTWHLVVDGEPLYIKGAGCGLGWGREGEDYLAMAREMGANSVRTWGTDQGTRDYLDRARRLGLKVACGIWINWADPAKGYSYLGDSDYKRSKRKEALEYVRRFKNHPSVLLWNVGNEALFFTKDEKEKVALAQFLEELIREIKKEDPHHPTLYAAAGTQTLPYLKKYVPSLDIVGMNIYGSIRSAQSAWEAQDFGKPYIITEYGPYLPIDSSKDPNGKSVELDDASKAMLYRNMARQIAEFSGCNLGGYVFHLGETTQDSLTWWNLNHGRYKKGSYWAMREMYTRKTPPPDIPRIRSLRLSPDRALRPGETIEAEVVLREDRPGWIYSYLLSTSEEGTLRYYVNDPLKAEIIQQDGPRILLRAPSAEGTYRLYCFVTNGKENMAAINKTIRVVCNPAREQ